MCTRINLICNFILQNRSSFFNSTNNPVYNIKRTDSDNLDFKSLVKFLDLDLAIRDGEDHSFFSQFNKIDTIKWVVVAYDGERAIGCGAIKQYGRDVLEVKRMFVTLEYRGKGIGSLILKDLEKWGRTLGYKKCILETGIKQPEAISLYKKNNYTTIPNYGQYAEVENSICFEKRIVPVDYNGKKFSAISNTENGQTSSDTIFQYMQKGNVLTSVYSGGEIVIGHIIGLVDGEGNIDMHYHHINHEGSIMTGICQSRPEVLPSGKIRLHEKWQWTSGDLSTGNSILEET